MIIKYKLKKNDISKYKTTVYSLREATEGSYYEKSESKMEMAMTQKVSDVFDNGISILKVNIDSSVLWKDGKEVTIKKKNKVFDMKMAASGEVLESSGSGPQSPPLFPLGDVSLNDEWTSEKEVSVSSHPDLISLKTIYRFDSLEKYQGFDCAKIAIKTEEVSLDFEEGVSQLIGGDGLIYFCYSDGKVIKSEVNTYTKTSLSEAEIKVTTQVVVKYDAKEENKISTNNFILSL